MNFSLARLELTQIFCDVDDFCKHCQTFNDRPIARLPYEGHAQRYQSRLSISEVMTIVIAFHGSGYKTFKAFYTHKVLPDWKIDFPHLVSYNRFIELMPWSVMPLMGFLNGCCLGQMSGVSFIDSTPLKVCHPNRATAHKTFQGLAAWGKSSVGWFLALSCTCLSVITVSCWLWH